MKSIDHPQAVRILGMGVFLFFGFLTHAFGDEASCVSEKQRVPIQLTFSGPEFKLIELKAPLHLSHRKVPQGAYQNWQDIHALVHPPQPSAVFLTLHPINTSKIAIVIYQKTLSDPHKILFHEKLECSGDPLPSDLYFF